MATPEQIQALLGFHAAAVASGHIWPAYAACEAADESSWGASKLAAQDLNLFGTKQHQHPIYGTVSIPTREFENAEWIVVNALWVKYPTLADCFADRMATLKALAAAYPHYAAALAAKTGEDYVTQVSLSWSTNPTRARDVLAIHAAHSQALAALNSSER